MNLPPVHPWAIAIGSAVLVAIVLFLSRGMLRRFAKNIESSKTWLRYIKGQGVLLSIFLVLGWTAAWGSTRLGPSHGRTVQHVRMIAFDSLSPVERAFRDIDTDNYATVTILANTVEPQNGVATISIYAERGGVPSTTSEVHRLTSVADSWSRWDQPVFGQRMRLLVGPPTEQNTATASRVRVVVYLSPK